MKEARPIKLAFLRHAGSSSLRAQPGKCRVKDLVCQPLSTLTPLRIQRQGNHIQVIETDVLFCSLGKTIQVISFLCGLIDAEEAKCFIIVMPLSLIENWKREFEKW